MTTPARSAHRVPFTAPEIRNVEDFWCWLNTWGDEHSHDLTRSEAVGYRKCISDAMNALARAGVGFPDEAWSRWTGL